MLRYSVAELEMAEEASPVTPLHVRIRKSLSFSFPLSLSPSSPPSTQTSPDNESTTSNTSSPLATLIPRQLHRTTLPHIPTYTALLQSLETNNPGPLQAYLPTLKTSPDTSALLHSLLTTAITHASHQCLPLLLSYLKNHPDLPQHVTPLTTTPVYLAARYNNPSLLPLLHRHKRLFSRFYGKVLTRTDDGPHTLYGMQATTDVVTPLHLAAASGSCEFIECVLGEGKLPGL